MKAPIFKLDGSSGTELELPQIFSAPVRQDLASRVFWMAFTHKLQPQGVDPWAGMRTSARTYNPPTGRGISRVPRVQGDRHPRSGMAAGIAMVVGGRQAHPPRSEKRIWKRINRKERRLAIAAAIAATARKELVNARGHRAEGIANLPLVVTDSIQSLTKAKDLRSSLRSLGLSEELSRLAKGRKRNSGKPALRGRVHRVPTGPLVVVADDHGISRAAGALGLDSTRAKDLNIMLLAPGGEAGRLVIWSESAIGQIAPVIQEAGDRLFMSGTANR